MSVASVNFFKFFLQNKIWISSHIEIKNRKNIYSIFSKSMQKYSQ